MDLPNLRIGRSGQEREQNVIAPHGIRLAAPHAYSIAPDPREEKQRARIV
jgi:hypothetical protein